MECPHCKERADFYTNTISTWNSNDVLVVTCSRCDAAIGCTVDIDDKVKEITELLRDISDGIEKMVKAVEHLR